MKKVISTSIFLLFMGLTVFAQVDNWKDHTSCGSNETPKATTNGPFTTTWTTTTQSSTQKEGTQNHYNGGIQGGGNIGVVNASGNAGYSRDGEKTTNNNGSSTTTTHSVTYDCIPNEKK